MTRHDFRLFIAIFSSLLLHLAPLLPGLLNTASAIKKPASMPLTATLAPPSAIPLQFASPPPTPAAAATPTPPPKSPAARSNSPQARADSWVQHVKKHLQQLDQKGLFYPRESIALGEQGEVLVLLILDHDGQVVGSRIEQSSGYPRLDDAALRAVRSLRALPADAPRETLIPVRFRLR